MIHLRYITCSLAPSSSLSMCECYIHVYFFYLYRVIRAVERGINGHSFSRFKRCAGTSIFVRLKKRHQWRLDSKTQRLASFNLPKCLDSFSITRLYGRCCVSFLSDRRYLSKNGRRTAVNNVTFAAARSVRGARRPRSLARLTSARPRSARV